MMTVCVSLDDFISVVVGEIYCLAPYHKPRFVNEIVNEVMERFKTECNHIGSSFFYHEIPLKNLYKFIENILMPIDKFRELNLSQDEYETGVKVDDEDRPKFAFVSALSDIPDDSDFVDLDACIQNIFTHYEQVAFRTWMYGNDGIPLDKLIEFRKIYEGE